MSRAVVLAWRPEDVQDAAGVDDPDVARLRGLVVACHPLPCLAVTAFIAGWAVSVGLPAGRVLLVAVAVLLGQLSIGWCNDAVDGP